MTDKRVAVIYSMEGGDLPIVLEVVDTEDINYVSKRHDYYKKFYKNVHCTCGVEFNVDKGSVLK